MVYWVVRAVALTNVTSTIPVPVIVPAPLMTCVVAPGTNEPFTVMVPPTLKLTPLVTLAPEFIVRLLNEVKMVAGKVVVLANTKVPVPGVQVLAVVVGRIVMSPLTVSVPPLVIVITPRAGVAPAFPKARLFTEIEDPLAKLMVPVLPVFPDPPKVASPSTLRAIFAFIVSVPVPLVALVLPNCKLPHAAVAVTVTVKLRSITTRSPATGTDAPAVPPVDEAQVVVEFQLPVATLYRKLPTIISPVAYVME